MHTNFCTVRESNPRGRSCVVGEYSHYYVKSAVEIEYGSFFTASASADSRSNWDALGGLYALLAQHDALGGHALARKSVRSPSRRLRFGRRSDPDMPPQAPVSNTLIKVNLKCLKHMGFPILPISFKLV
jgi:hypothetical protein